jgi:heat shock protein HslJ
MTTRRHLGAAALAALLLGAAASACSSSSSDGADDPAPRDAAVAHPLVDRTFVSTSVTEDGDPKALVDGTEVTLGFEGGQLQANAGCNHLLGDLAIEDDTLVVTRMGGTEMGCPGGRQEQDDWLIGVLTSSPTWRLDGDTLTITSGTTTIELVDEASVTEDAPLVGTTWVLDTIVEGDTASSVPAGVEAHIAFETDGQVVGSNGCNGFGGSYTAEQTSVRFDLMGQTLIGCGDPMAAVERRVMAVLTGDVAYAIDGDALTLTAASGDGLAFRARA